jgi:tetratricopeptide (TPR) repeat protein
MEGVIGSTSSADLLFICLGVWGIIKCHKIAKRETTCKKCVYGLGITLIGLLIPFTNVIFKSAKLISLGLVYFTMVASLIVLICGAVIASIGLVEYKHHPEYKQGKGQAITAIILSILIVGFYSFGMYKSITERDKIPMRSQMPQPVNLLQKFEDLNFQFRIPDRSWAQMDAKKVNPATTFAMLNGREKIFFMIVAEKGGVDLEFNSSSLAEIYKANLKSVATRVNFSKEEIQEVNGLKGIRFSAKAVISGRNISYRVWVCEHNGYFYQLVASGLTYNKKIEEFGDKLISNFRQLDKDRVIYSEMYKPYESFTSDTFAYRVNLKGASWKQWDELEESYPNAETGGLMTDGTSFFIIPFYYGSQGPSLDVLTDIFMNAFDIRFPGKKIENLKRIKEAGMEGYRFRTKVVLESGSYVLDNKVLKGKYCGYLVTVFIPGKEPVKNPGVDQVYAALTFLPQKRSHRKQWKRVTEGFSPRMKVAHSIHYNQWGITLLDSKQISKSLGLLKTAAQLNPGDHVIVENLLSNYNQMHQYKEGIAYLDSLASLPKENQGVRSWKAFFYAQLQRRDEAVKIYDRLFAEDYRNDDDFIQYIQVLKVLRKWDRAAAAFEKYLKKGDSLKIRLEQSRFLYAQKKYRDAIELLNKLQKDIPFNVSIAYYLIDNYSALNEYKEGLEVCRKIIDNGFASKDAFYEKGNLEYNLKWYRKAKESYEKALKYSPKDKIVKADLKYVSALLGEGDNSMIKDAISPVVMPAAVAKNLPSLDARPADPGYSAYYISKVHGIHYQAGKRMKCTREERIKVLNASGVSRFSTLQVKFDPIYEKVFVNKLDVYGSAGKIISRGKPSDYYVLDTPGGETASHKKTLHMPVPHLVPGATIHLTWSREKSGKYEEFPFYNVIFSSDLPVLFSAWYVTGDVHKLTHKSINGIETETFDKGMSWYMKNPPLYHWEPNQTEYTRFLPVLWLNEAAITWKTIGQRYLEDIREKMQPEPPVAALARKLTQGKQTNRQKIAALARHLQEKYTYKAIEFGERSYIPNKASRTIANKYGDCKDHALLFHQLLKALDIPSYLVLVNLSDEIKPDLPSFRQFDHVIVFIPGDKVGGFFDTTDKNLDLQVGIPSGLGGKYALILNPGNFELVKIPAYKPGSTSVVIRKNVRIMNPRESEVRETVKVTGYSAASLRRYLKSMETGKHSDWAYRFMSQYIGMWELKNMRIKGIDDNTQPVSVELDYKLTGPPRVPAAWEAYYLEITAVKDRKTPFRLYYPFHLTSTCKVQAPTGYELDTRDNANKPGKEQEAFGTWQSTVKDSSQNLDIQLNFKLVPGEYQSRFYARYTNMMNNAAKAIKIDFKCRKK